MSVSPGKEMEKKKKHALTLVEFEPMTSLLDLPSLCSLSYEVVVRGNENENCLRGSYALIEFEFARTDENEKFFISPSLTYFHVL